MTVFLVVKDYNRECPKDIIMSAFYNKEDAKTFMKNTFEEICNCPDRQTDEDELGCFRCCLWIGIDSIEVK